jgi:non-homologous end joining protein Ku
MPPRPHWKGYLKLSLVSCPIGLYPAISAAEKVSFRHVNRETGHRLRQQLVDSVTGDVVESHNRGRGYEVGENQFLIVQDEELEAAQQEGRTRPFSAEPPHRSTSSTQAEQEPPRRGPALKLVNTKNREEAPPIVPPPAPPRPIIENTRTIELDRFITRDQIDPRYCDKPYYIAPRDQVGLEAFAVIRDAMAGKGLIGMGRVVLASRERPIIIEPMGRGLRGTILRYAHEVRSEEEYFADIPQMTLPEEMLRITAHILETKKEDFDPAYLEDRYRTVLVEKLREKQAQMPARSVASTPSPQNVINLMEALKRSLTAEKPTRSTSSTKPKPRRSAGLAKPTPAKRSGGRARGAG